MLFASHEMRACTKDSLALVGLGRCEYVDDIIALQSGPQIPKFLEREGDVEVRSV